MLKTTWSTSVTTGRFVLASLQKIGDRHRVLSQQILMAEHGD